MPFELEFHHEPEHARVVLHGQCSHQEILRAIHGVYPDPRTSKARGVIWDTRDAKIYLSAAEIREAVKALGEHRERTGWGVTVALAPDEAIFAQGRMAESYASMENVREVIHVCKQMDEALDLLGP